MSRRRLYSVELERPSRRYGPPPSLRLALRWDGHEQAYVHKPSGATLEGHIFCESAGDYYEIAGGSYRKERW